MLLLLFLLLFYMVFFCSQFCSNQFFGSQNCSICAKVKIKFTWVLREVCLKDIRSFSKPLKKIQDLSSDGENSF